MIELYDFGEIVIDGRRYVSDVILLGGEVRSGWWRREGHELAIEDLEEILKFKPEVLVVGTGYSGLMKVPDNLRRQLESLGVRVIVQLTAEACKTYNSLLKSGVKVAAALHLTC